MASPNKKTQGAAIIVFGFQGGMISGIAIGSLLVGNMGSQGVFTLGAMIAAATSLYAVRLLPIAPPRGVRDPGLTFALRKLGRDMGRVMRNLEFLKTMFLVGIPTKAVMTGVILFALPLLLSRMQYAQEDIGQIIMLYAAGVLVASYYIPRFVDRTGKTALTMFWGTALSGVGLLLIGMIGWEPLQYIPNAPTYVLVAGVVVVGFAHGFIYAPVVTHVANSPLSASIGANSVTATYRFLERFGHAAGPMIVGQLFWFGGENSMVVIWIAAMVVVLALLFLFRFQPAAMDTRQAETAP